jgi:hypothetical protein
LEPGGLDNFYVVPVYHRWCHHGSLKDLLLDMEDVSFVVGIGSFHRRWENPKFEKEKRMPIGSCKNHSFENVEKNKGYLVSNPATA